VVILALAEPEAATTAVLGETVPLTDVEVGRTVYVTVEKHRPLGRLVGAGQKTGSSSPLPVAVLVEKVHLEEDPFEEQSYVALGVIVDVGGMLVWIVKTGSSDGDESFEAEIIQQGISSSAQG
jgi:hypothetical protein